MNRDLSCLCRSMTPLCYCFEDAFCTHWRNWRFLPSRLLVRISLQLVLKRALLQQFVDGKGPPILTKKSEEALFHRHVMIIRESYMGADPKWGTFPHLSRNVPFCPRLSSFVLLGARNEDKSGQKRTNGDKTGHFGTKRETPPLRIYPHWALPI